MSPDVPPRAAARARRAAAGDAVAGGAVHRDAGRGGRHLARPALPLLRRQAGVPHRRRAPGGRRPVRGHRPRRARARPLEQLAGSLERYVDYVDARTTTATSRWCAAPPAATRSCARSTRSPAPRSPAGSSRARSPRRPLPSALTDTPAVRLLVHGLGGLHRGRRPGVGPRRPRGHSRRAAADPRRRRCRGSWRRCARDVPSSVGCHRRRLGAGVRTPTASSPRTAAP